MTERRPTGLDHFSDEDARRILKRAAELERTGVVTETDLREIAAGASISQAAVDRALAEALQEKGLAELTPRGPSLYLVAGLIVGVFGG